jgi:hypothetical protein
MPAAPSLANTPESKFESSTNGDFLQQQCFFFNPSQTLAALFTCPCSAMGKTRKDLGPGRRAGEDGEHVRAC